MKTVTYSLSLNHVLIALGVLALMSAVTGWEIFATLFIVVATLTLFVLVAVVAFLTATVIYCSLRD